MKLTGILLFAIGVIAASASLIYSREATVLAGYVAGSIATVGVGMIVLRQ